MCPGVSFALQVLHLTLANALHWFEFETLSGEAVDMREAPGLTSPKATLYLLAFLLLFIIPLVNLVVTISFWTIK